MEDTALTIEHLCKSYGDLKAVDDVSFCVKKGALFAFLGVNGAGKSTTINIICSILQKDGGKIYVHGRDLDVNPAEIKREIGIVFQNSVLDKELTVKQNLEIRSSFYPLTKGERKANLDEIVKLLELEPILNRAVKHLSGGQLRRVDIARAMVHKPNLLMLDEPTTGLDPKTRLAVWSLIDGIRSTTGMTVFLTTHYLEEAEKASDVVIMDSGKILVRGTPNELKNRFSSDKIVCYRQIDSAFESALAQKNIPYTYDGERGAYSLTIKDTAEAKRILREFDGYLTDVEILKGNMDDVFLNVTGKNIGHGGEQSG